MKVVNGISYHDRTPDAVIGLLERSRTTGVRLRLHYGQTDPEKPDLGLDWMEENDVEGKIGNSMGPVKVPILLANARSTGGPQILDHCIVRITDTLKPRNSLWKHQKYHRPTITIRPIGLTEKVGKTRLRDEGYTHTVCFNGEMHANFKSYKAACRYLERMC